VRYEVLIVMYAFGVGLANFAGGRHLSPREVVARIARELPLVASYGPTGNVALEDGPVVDAPAALAMVTGTAWAVVRAEHLESGLNALAAMSAPSHAADERPTPGLAFAVTAGYGGSLTSTSRAILQRLSGDMIIVWKLDRLDGSRLHKDRRGGWGAISTDISRQIGGRWTARSRRTLDGLHARVPRA
jgi:hypothetical protein